MRRDFRAVAGELSLLRSLQRKDSSPCTGLRVGRKLRGLPHDTLRGWRKVARFQADEPPPRGACVGPHELSVAGACAGVFKGLLFSSVPATALVLSPSLPLCTHPHHSHSLLLSLLFGLSLRLWTTVSWLTLDLACAPQVPAAIADFYLNHRSIVKPFLIAKMHLF